MFIAGQYRSTDFSGSTTKKKLFFFPNNKKKCGLNTINYVNMVLTIIRPDTTNPWAFCLPPMRDMRTSVAFFVEIIIGSTISRNKFSYEN